MRGRILIVEDDEPLREVLAMILHDLGVELLWAADGREALDVLATHEVHAVMTDIRMPRMSGLELLREARRRHLNLPFVFVTGYCERSQWLEALGLGAFDFIEKPFQGGEILRAAENALRLGLEFKRGAVRERRPGSDLDRA